LKLSPEFPGKLPFDVPLPYACPFVVGFFSLAKAQFYLYPSPFEVKREGDQGKSLFLHFSGYAFYFFPVEEEPLFPVRVVVKDR
jgi:hypothetical protein